MVKNLKILTAAVLIIVIGGFLYFSKGNVFGLTYFPAQTAVSYSPTSSASFNPNVANTYSLGSQTYTWKDLYLSGTAYVSSSLLTASNNLADIGAYGTAFKNAYVSSTVFATNLVASSTLVDIGTAGAPSIAASAYQNTGFYWSPAGFIGTVGGTSIAGFISSGFSPAAANTFDLGQMSVPFVGSLTWRDVNASGTARFATSSIFQPNATSTISATTGITAKGGQILLKDVQNGNCYAFYSNGGTLTTSGSQVTCE